MRSNVFSKHFHGIGYGCSVIDLVFRGGKKHGNHGDTARKMVRHIVGKIRKRYREDVPIILKQFAPNAAYYAMMALAFFLLEAFKEDVCAGVIPVTAYATTVRRKLIDIAAKIVATTGRIILKVTAAAWKTVKCYVLWKWRGLPPRFICT